MNKFKEVGVILGTQGPFRNIVQIKIGNAHSVEFDFLEWWQLHKLYPQDWIVIHTHAPEVGAEFSNRDIEFYKAVELALKPYHCLFIVYEPKSGMFDSRYEDLSYIGRYDVFGNYFVEYILPGYLFDELLRQGLKFCFHLNYLVSRL